MPVRVQTAQTQQQGQQGKIARGADALHMGPGGQGAVHTVAGQAQGRDLEAGDAPRPGHAPALGPDAFQGRAQRDAGQPQVTLGIHQGQLAVGAQVGQQQRARQAAGQQAEQPGADVAAHEGRGQGRDQQRRQPFHGQAAAARMAAPVGRGAQAADVPVQKNVGHGRIGRQYQPLHRDAGQGGRLLPQQGRQMVTYQPGEPGPAFGCTGHGQTGHDVRTCPGLRVEVVPFGHHGHRQGRTAEQGKIIRGRFFPDIGDGDQAPVQRCGAQVHGQGQMVLFREGGRGRGHDRHFFRCGHIEMQLRAHGVSYLTTAGQTPAPGQQAGAQDLLFFRQGIGRHGQVMEADPAAAATAQTGTKGHGRRQPAQPDGPGQIVAGGRPAAARGRGGDVTLPGTHAGQFMDTKFHAATLPQAAGQGKPWSLPRLASFLHVFSHITGNRQS